jgi:hypothetical protein
MADLKRLDRRPPLQRTGSLASSAGTPSEVPAGSENPRLALYNRRARNDVHQSVHHVNAALHRSMNPPTLETEGEHKAERERRQRELAALKDEFVRKRKTAHPGDISPPTAALAGPTSTTTHRSQHPATTTLSRAPTATSLGRAASGHQLSPLLRTAHSSMVNRSPRNTSPSRLGAPLRFSPAPDSTTHLTEDAIQRQREAALDAFNAHFAGAFRPLSVAEDDKRSRANTPWLPGVSQGMDLDEPGSARSSHQRAWTPALAEVMRRKESDFQKRRIDVESGMLRKATRGYIKDATNCLRNDPELFESFSQQVDSQRRAMAIKSRSSSRATTPAFAMKRPSVATTIDDSGDGQPRVQRVPSPVREILEQRKIAAEVAHRVHEDRCARAYETKQRYILEDYLRFEEELETTRGEKFSRLRWFVSAIQVVDAYRAMTGIIDRHRAQSMDTYVSGMCAEHEELLSQQQSLIQGAASGPGFSTPRQTKRGNTGKYPALNSHPDVIGTVHKAKIIAVETRKENAKALPLTAEMRMLLKALAPIFPYWLKRHAKRRKARSVTILVSFLNRARERARARLHIKKFLQYAHLIVDRWRAAFVREKERFVTLSRQWDRYAHERYVYDEAMCAVADREMRKREKAIAKAAQIHRTAVAQSTNALSPLRERRRVADLVERAPTVFAEGGNGQQLATAVALAALGPSGSVNAFTGMSPYGIARIVAAPYMLPHPFGAKLGPDPSSARTAALVTLHAVNNNRLTWKLPPRAKEFVCKYINARERLAHSVRVSAWAAVMAEARVKHTNLVFAAEHSVGSVQKLIKEELERFTFPPLPQRSHYLRPNEMRFWVHFAVVLHLQERRMHADNGVSVDRTVDPNIVAAVYTVRNAQPIFAKCVAQLGVKLTGIRPGHFDDLPYPIDVPLPAGAAQPAPAAADNANSVSGTAPPA